MLREGMFIADRYEILEKIGSGGMSEVYKAMDHKLNRYVAMKVLKSDFSEDKTFVTKFRAEAQSAAGLMHSNIVNVYDVGEEDGLHYIVMELVEGITLKKYIERKGRLGTREAVSIAIQVAQGIEAAHKHHIVHRDIKPQNIIISKEGKVKVTDFGIARAATSNTINSAVMGSVHYISPEQARGGYSDEKSDIYSFGITLFEMLTGQVPFEGDSTVAVALQHIQDDMASPKTIVSDIPISVEKIVMKCTQKKTERRYQNASDLIADLKRSLVTPNEDFVVISAMIPSDGATHIIGDEDLVEISQRSAVKATTSDLMDMDFEDEPDEPDKDFDDDDLSDDPDEYDEDEDEDDGKPNKKLDRIITIAGIVVAVLILIFTILLIRKMTGGSSLFGGNEQTTTAKVVETQAQTGVVVPKVIGMTFEEAKEELNKAGLGIKQKSEYSTYAEGIIFEQSIEPGEGVTENTTVIVTISKGPEESELEDVIGKPQEEAESYLKGLGLVITYQYEETDDETLIGKVSKTIPVTGSKVASGDKITVTIYAGATVKNVKVPDVTGKTEAAARKTIENAGLVVGTVVSAYDDKVASGLVISQSGATVDTEVPEDSVVNFVVSLGAEPETTTVAPTKAQVNVPDLKDKSEKDAKNAIVNANLTVGKITYDYSDTIEKGKVISQSQAANTKVEEGTTINFVLSEGKKVEETTPEATTTAAETTTAVATIKYSSESKITISSIESAIQGEYSDTAKIKSISVLIRVVDSKETDEYIKKLTFASFEELQKASDFDVAQGESKTQFVAGKGTAYAAITFYTEDGSDMLSCNTYKNGKIAIEIKSE